MQELQPTPAKPRAAEQAAHNLRLRILKGELRAGDFLPPERQLSDDLGVSRLTLRSALAHLEAQGLIQPLQGAGNRVLDFRRHGGLELVGPLLELAREGGDVPLTLLEDLLAIRRLAAGEVVEMAARRAEPADLEGMRAHILYARSVIEQPKRFVAADLGFARMMVKAAHSLALELLTNPILRVLERQEGIEFAFMMNPEGALNVYDAIVDRVEKRDAVSARRVAERLLARQDQLLLGGLRVLTGGWEG